MGNPDDVWPSGPIKSRLKTIRELLPGRSEIVYEFAERVEQLTTSPKLSRGWYICLFMIANHVTRNRAKHDEIVRAIPEIVDAVCDQDFAQEIHRFMRLIRAYSANHAFPKKPQ